MPGSDPEWAISEIKKWANSKWVAAVWIHLPPGLPVDDPDLDPVFATMNDLDLPLVHHSFFMEPPYFPGHQDIWGNSVVARTAAHPWGAGRLCAYLIVSGLFDKYPNLRASVSEVGHGWLPNWVIRLGFNKSYGQGLTPELKYTPIEYVQMGRFRCAAEPFEGPLMTEACVKILGEDCLMHQSDYPHGQAWFPETAKEVMEWDFWGNFSPGRPAEAHVRQRCGLPAHVLEGFAPLVNLWVSPSHPAGGRGRGVWGRGLLGGAAAVDDQLGACDIG